MFQLFTTQVYKSKISFELKELSKEIQKPWAVYEVSGEYAAIELMNEKGLMNGQAAHVESWTALARAGAQIIISYGARYAKEWLK